MKYLLTLVGGVLVGFVVGALLVFFVFVGVKRAQAPPPQPTVPVGSAQTGTATVTLDEPFFGAVLNTIFKDINAPSFPLTLAGVDRREHAPGIVPAALFQDSCDGKVVLLPEGSGVRTAVTFKDGKVVAPLAFKGSYNFLGVCVNFTGWAQANIDMRFDEAKQTVYGQVNIDSVNLDDSLAGFSNLVTPMVQESINQRVNPLEILRAPQLALAVNVKSSDGTLRAKVRAVNAEVTSGEVRLHITYDFAGQKGQQPDLNSL